MFDGVREVNLMDDSLKPIIETIHQRFGVEAHESHGLVSLTIHPDQLISLVKTLRNEFDFDMLAAETAVDYWPEQSPRFHMIYELYCTKQNIGLELRVPLNGNAPTLPTLEVLYANANWHEREVWDMFGIKFEGHSDLRRILMPFDWEGYPLRKDYPLGYEEPQFTFNFDQIMVHKPHPKS